MSNQIDPLNNSLNIQTIKTIDQLNLPIMQKHHLRILFHCLVILRATNDKNDSTISEEDSLREWCNKQSQKFNDQKFNDLLYDQLVSTSKKLKNLSLKLKKNINDLDINDLIILVSENQKNN